MSGRQTAIFISALLFFTLNPFGLAIAASQGDAWVWPVEGEVITAYKNDNNNPYSGGMHRGIDIAAPVGARVVAAKAGTVRFAGQLGSSGIVVSVSDSNRPYVESYLHLSGISVSRGEEVIAGQAIGRVGETGSRSSERPHLHFGIRDAGNENFYYDPLEFLPALPARGASSPSPAKVNQPLPVLQPMPVAARKAARGARSSVKTGTGLRPYPVSRPRTASVKHPVIRAGAVTATRRVIKRVPQAGSSRLPAMGASAVNGAASGARSQKTTEPGVNRGLQTVDGSRSPATQETAAAQIETTPFSIAKGKNAIIPLTWVAALLLLLAAIGGPMARRARSGLYSTPAALFAFKTALRSALASAARALEALAVRTVNLLHRDRLLPGLRASFERFLPSTARTVQR